MDKIDENLFNFLKNRENAPKGCDEIIKTALKENKINKNTNIIRKSVSICAGILVIFGCAYAGKITYEKIWKDPKEYSSYEEITKKKREEYLESITNNTLNEEEKANLISEDEARDSAEKFMKKFDINKQIVSIKSVGRVYNIQTNNDINKGIIISIDAINGEVVRFIDNDILYNKISPDKISENEAKNIANQLYKIATENKYPDYELYKIEETSRYIEQIKNEIWSAKWGKNYDNAFYSLDYISISFYVKNGKTILNNFAIVKNNEFENNPIVISKDQGIEIAKEKDREITTKEINTIQCEIDIQQMNPFVYAQEKSGGTDDGTEQKQISDNRYITYDKYYMESKYRKIWKIKIDYKQQEAGSKDIKGRIYYVDTTTGEIIGGMWGTMWEYLQ